MITFTADQMDAAYGVILDRDPDLFWDEDRTAELRAAVLAVASERFPAGCAE